MSEDWHAFRKKGIGSSDAPVIMGVSPWSTLYRIWGIKTGRLVNEESNWATRKGIAMEPKARAHYELMESTDMPALCMVHYQAPWLRASLDGFNGETVLEIKCPGKVDHALALEGRVPDKYYPQLQHQLIVTGAPRAHYFSFDGSDGVIVEVHPDEDFQRTYLDKAYDFWRLVETDTPPPLVDRDWKLIRSKPFAQILKMWDESGRGEIMGNEVLKWSGTARVRNGAFRIDGINRTIDKLEGEKGQLLRV